MKAGTHASLLSSGRGWGSQDWAEGLQQDWGSGGGGQCGALGFQEASQVTLGLGGWLLLLPPPHLPCSHGAFVAHTASALGSHVSKGLGRVKKRRRFLGAFLGAS